jgi:V/A-type H+-transporting ATPase subunit E
MTLSGGKRMELELTNIIEKLKTEGVGEADKEAARIISEAKDKAKSIVDGAKKDKEKMVHDAEQQAAMLKKNGEEALQQASRDTLLALKQSITKLFDSAFRAQVSAEMSPDVLKDMIVRLVENIAKEKTFNVEVLVSDKDKKELEKTLFAALKGELQKKVTLKTSPNVERGFLIGEKDGTSFYDFTDGAVAEAFTSYLNPKIAELLVSDEK